MEVVLVEDEDEDITDQPHIQQWYVKIFNFWIIILYNAQCHIAAYSNKIAPASTNIKQPIIKFL